MGKETNQQQATQDQTTWDRWQAWSGEHRIASFLITVLAIIIALLLAIIIFWALVPSMAPPWTGFAETAHPLYTGRSPAKTLWDWLGVLIIPLFLAIGAAVLSHAQQDREMRARSFEQKLADQNRQHDWEIEMDRQEQALVDRYFERITGYLLDYGLRSSDEDAEIRTIARASTLGILNNINVRRKAQVLLFLYETNLIITPNPVVNLAGANLREIDLDSAVLPQAHLAATDMHGAHLDRADLSGADLSGTDLIDAHLRQANLSDTRAADAYLSGARMQKALLRSAVLTNSLLNDAVLHQADLRGADLSGANLVGADLSEALLQGTNLQEARFKPTKASGDDEEDKILHVEGATYDDRTHWPDGFDPAAQDAVQTN